MPVHTTLIGFNRQRPIFFIVSPARRRLRRQRPRGTEAQAEGQGGDKADESVFHGATSCVCIDIWGKDDIMNKGRGCRK